MTEGPRDGGSTSPANDRASESVSPSLSALLDGVVRLLENDTGTASSILLYDRDADCLRVGAAPHLPRALVAALDGIAVGPASGVCGTAIRRGERVIVEDVRTDPACAALAVAAGGLRGCLSEPIRDLEGHIVGTVAMYFGEARGPTEVERARVGAAAHLAAIAIRSERAQTRAVHLARLYSVSSGINEALLRSDDAAHLYDIACRLAVERGLASFAWLGLHHPDDDVVEPVSRSGADAELLMDHPLSLRDPRVRESPAARALHTGQPAISNDIAGEPPFHGQDAALARGYRAVAAFPLRIGADHPYGVLVLFSAALGGFGDEAVEVLSTLAADLSFTIELARDERARIRTVSALADRSAQLLRMERLYAALSEVNRAIVRATSPGELMERTVTALVETGGIAMAWVGKPDPATQRIVPVARAGDRDGYIDRIAVYADDRPGGRGPAGRALREDRVVLAENFVSQVDGDPCRGEAEHAGWRAAAALPLRCREERWGVLIPYAREVGFFGDAEVALLEQVARDVSFALDVLAHEAQRRATDIALRNSEDRLRVVQRLGDAIQSAPDAEHTLQHAVRILGEHLGASRCAYADIDIARDNLEVPHDYVVGCRSVVGRHLASRMVSGETVEKLKAGVPLVLRDAGTVDDPEIRARFAHLQIGAIVMCGLVRQGELRAAMAVHSIAPRDWSDHEVGLVQEFVERCWDQIERRAAEAKLREHQALLRIASAAAKLGGWSIDLPTLRTTCSDEVCAILDVPPGTAVTVDQTVAWCLPQDRELLRTRGLACATEGAVLDIEIQLLTSRGRPVWVRLMGRAERSAAGTIARLHGALQDISDRKLLEDQLRQAQKMEAVGQLAGGVAHDFNNLLSVILTCSAILAEDLAPNDPARTEVLEIQKAGERAAALTRQLLTFSRHQILKPRVIHLAQVVTGMEKMLRHLLGASVGLTLLTPSSTGQVRADPGQIEQVIMNLVVNARDAMPAGGQVVVDIANDEVSGAGIAQRPDIPEGRYVRLAVTDTGTGMEPATRARIFEPFFTTKGQGKGTGLGLSTVFGIVAQSGGHLRVESGLGVGSTFEIYLPRVDDAPERMTSETQAPAPKGNETILVVEDDEQVRTVVCTTLRRAGYRVLEAQNGGEAFLISEQRQEPIDMLLTDVVMPRMQGPELAARLSPTRPEMRVLYMSGYNEDAVLREGVREGGVEFISKPFTPSILLARIRAVLSAAALNPRSDRP